MAANDEGTVFGSKAVEQLARAVRDNEHRMMLPRGHRGRWQNSVGTGAVVTEVRFQIVSSDPTTFTGLAEILAWDYGFVTSQIPAATVGYTIIEICDPMGCFLNETNTELTGRQGVATYRQGTGGDDCRTGYAPFPGVWEVSTLCCKLINCDVVI